MAHLPLFTPVTIVDVDLSAVVGEATMQAFKQELLHRSLRWAQVRLPSPSPQALSASSSSSSPSLAPLTLSPPLFAPARHVSR
jgi:hypothetical protein